MSNNFFRILGSFIKTITIPSTDHKLINYSANILTFLLGTSIQAIYALTTQEKEEIRVVNKYKMVNYGFTQFMVVDQKGRHFNVNNSLWYWKWDSIEDWSQIKKDTPLSVKYYGWRMPVFGLFPNIVMSRSTKQVECSHCKTTELKL